MICKATVVISTALAVGTFAVAVLSFWVPLCWDTTPTAPDFVWHALAVSEGNLCVATWDKGRGYVRWYVLEHVPGRERSELLTGEALEMAEWENAQFIARTASYRRLVLLHPKGRKGVVFRSWDDWSVAGLSRMHAAGLHLTLLVFPLWLPLAVFTAYPAITFIRGSLRRYRRRRKSLCVACGYSLTGNVSGVCPECGESV